MSGRISAKPPKGEPADSSSACALDLVRKIRRNCKTLDPYTDDDRRAILLAIRDASLEWWGDCAMTRNGQGIINARGSYEDACDKLGRLGGGEGTEEKPHEIVWALPTEEQLRRMAEAKSRAEAACKSQ